jgi:hypothetical protein
VKGKEKIEIAYSSIFEGYLIYVLSNNDIKISDFVCLLTDSAFEVNNDILNKKE